jgi:hypothetical protein
MLQTQTVDARTFSILKTLMEIPEIQSFNLVGGTALSLKYGHRTSVDLDLFTVSEFAHQPVIDSLTRTFGDLFVHDKGFGKWGIFCHIDRVKVDLVYYPHPLLYAVECRDTIRMYDDRDLIAMKIQAILGRGKKKDFWDIYELMKHYDLSEMIDFHRAKYPAQILMISIPQALIWFVDADADADNPFQLKQQKWERIKDGIRKKVREFLA